MRHIIFGESHGPAIGVVLEQVPSGILLDEEEIAREMARRAPGKNALSTARRESDIPRILSGVFLGRTTGTPLCAVIENNDQHSRDYEKTRHLARPGHADYTGSLRYHGYNDYRGGGHFSGRLTAPLVFAGAVAKQILALQNIFVGAHIRQIAGIAERAFTEEDLTADRFRQVSEKAFPALDDACGEAMQAQILTAKGDRDSVGGVIECAVIGVPAGVGAPDFGLNVEGIISQHLFAVPAVKGVSFGAGFAFAEMRGSQANDPFYMKESHVRTKTNHSGGVNGGITNGMPILFQAVMRPTPSIGQEQETVDMDAGVNAKLTIEGRHDPCIVHRAVPVIEAAAALAVCELLGI